MDIIKLSSAKRILKFDTSSRDWICLQKTPRNFVGRGKVLDNIDDWLKAEKVLPLKKYLWIHGALGSGKSALATHIVERIRSNNIGKVDIFFCDASTDNTRHASDIIKFLASILAGVCGDVYFNEDLVDYILDESFKSALPANLFAKLIGMPVSKLQNNAKVYIVIDALDEMLTSECEILLDILFRFNPPEWLKIILTSRPELPIGTELNTYSEEVSLDDDDGNKSDIMEYFHDELSDRDDDYISALAEKSAGNFLYAKHICDYIKTYGDIREDALPDSLNALYKKMLDRKYKNVNRDDGTVADFEKEARGIFEVLVAIKSPVAMQELANILGISFADLTRYMDTVSSFVKCSASNNEVRIYNPSFADYLTDIQYNPYYVDKSNGEKRLLDYIEANNAVLLESGYFKRYGLTHIVETQSSLLLTKIIQSPHQSLSDKIENDLYYVYLTNSADVIRTFRKIDIKIIRRILLSTYRKGVSHGRNTSDDDCMADILVLLRENGELVRATMLEGERLQRMEMWDDAAKKFNECLEIAKNQDGIYNNSWSRRYIALTYNRLGNLANKSGNGDAAQYYASGYKIFKEIVEMNDTDAIAYRSIYIKDLAIATARIGDLKIKRSVRNIDEVIGYYTEYNKYCELLVGTEQSAIGYRRERANSFRRLGDAYMFCDVIKAYNMFILALRDMQDIVRAGATNTCGIIDEVDVSEMQRGEDVGKIAHASYEILPYEHREPDYLREHALCYFRLMVAAYYAKRIGLAAKWNEYAVAACKQINDKRATVESKNDLEIAMKWNEKILKEIKND